MISQLLEFVNFSPGVIITEIHKRGGQSDEEYKQVIMSGILYAKIVEMLHKCTYS